MRKLTIILTMVLILPIGARAQRTLTLEECRKMAMDSNRELDQARQKIKMAEYDRKTAVANYFPNITATGTYQYNSRKLNLIGDEMSGKLENMGTAVQQQIGGSMQQLMAAIQANPAAAREYMTSPMWQTVIGALSQTDVSAALNQIGSEISQAFNLDITNMYVGAISVQQPVFMGGKIVASNKMASLAEELSKIEYESKRGDILVDIDRAYWQIVSIANKKRLAQTYLELLETMLRNGEIAVEEGTAVKSDVLTIKVKFNEAKMLLSRSENGLALSKMLLCKQIGLPLDSEITLADEFANSFANVGQPSMTERKDMNQILADRPETRSLDLASQIYERKYKIARSDMLPKVALTANYLISNPSAFNGFKTEFGGMFNAGVMVSIPLFHGTEAYQKTRKAKAEALLYKSKYDDACELINLEVEQLGKQEQEAFERLQMAQSNLESAEENLRSAMIGFEEGVVETVVTLQAQAAWMQANSEYIDAGIELKMNHTKLLKAQGEIDTIH